MRIAATQYNLQNKALEIYISGCCGDCRGCHNPELKSFAVGEELSITSIKAIRQKIRDFDSLIDALWILGGEPLDNNIWQLNIFLDLFKPHNKEIWLWTRYEIEDVPDRIKNKCDYIKTGAYDRSLLVDNNLQYGIKLASSNQKLIKINGGNNLVI